VQEIQNNQIVDINKEEILNNVDENISFELENEIPENLALP